MILNKLIEDDETLITFYHWMMIATKDENALINYAQPFATYLFQYGLMSKEIYYLLAPYITGVTNCRKIPRKLFNELFEGIDYDAIHKELENGK